MKNDDKAVENIREQLRKQGFTFSKEERKDHALPDSLWILTVHHSD